MIPNHLCRISSKRKYLGFGVLAAGGNAMHFQDRCSSSCINLQLWTFAKCYHLMRLPTQFSTILWQESLHRVILSSFKFPATIFRSFNGIFKGIGWRAGISSIYMCNWEHDSPYCPYLFIHFTYYSLNVPTWKVLKSKIVTCYLISWHQNVLNNLGGERDCFVLCYLGLCWILVQRSIKSSLSCSIYWAQISLQGKWTQITSKVPTHSWGWEQGEDI